MKPLRPGWKKSRLPIIVLDLGVKTAHLSNSLQESQSVFPKIGDHSFELSLNISVDKVLQFATQTL